MILSAKADFQNTWMMDFKRVPVGNFMMGKRITAQDYFTDEVIHAVTLTRPYLIQTTPVNQAQWEIVMGSNPSKFTGDPLRPVDSVSWNDAQAFIRSLNEMAGLTATEGYRLPTEAEWEYAARAGTTGPFYFDADPEELVNHAWFDQNASKQTHPVAQKTPNPWGLYDIYGNVWEWVQDYIADFPLYAQIDPTGPIKGSKRVVRGGCYMNGNYRCNSYARGMLSPSQRKSSSGFRLAKSVVIELKA